MRDSNTTLARLFSVQTVVSVKVIYNLCFIRIERKQTVWLWEGLLRILLFINQESQNKPCCFSVNVEMLHGELLSTCLLLVFCISVTFDFLCGLVRRQINSIRVSQLFDYLYYLIFYGDTIRIKTFYESIIWFPKQVGTKSIKQIDMLLTCLDTIIRFHSTFIGKNPRYALPVYRVCNKQNLLPLQWSQSPLSVAGGATSAEFPEGFRRAARGSFSAILDLLTATANVQDHPQVSQRNYCNFSLQLQPGQCIRNDTNHWLVLRGAFREYSGGNF